MTNKLELYKCNICGNVIEGLISGDGHPVCCGEEMERIEVRNDDMNSEALTAKHSPIIMKNDDGKTVVSVTNHPMDENHYIMFVQAISKDGNEINTKFFYPNQTAELVSNISEDIKARAYCNLHGLYVNK